MNQEPIALHISTFQGGRKNLAAVAQRWSTSARKEEKKVAGRQDVSKVDYTLLQLEFVSIWLPQLKCLDFDCAFLGQVGISIPSI